MDTTLSASLTLTSTRPIIIDLTESPSPPASPTPPRLTLTPGHAPAHELPAPPQDEGSAAKKRRINRALPFVSRAVKTLSESDYDVEKIAVQVGGINGLPKKSRFHAADSSFEALTTLMNDPSTSNTSTIHLTNDKTVSLRVERIVRNLASQQKYQKRPPKRPASQLSLDETNTFLETSTSPTSASSASRQTDDSHSAATPQPTGAPQSIPARQTSSPISEIGRQRRRPLLRRSNREQPSSSLNTWFKLPTRPYQTAKDRQLIARGLKGQGSSLQGLVREPTVFHVDFSEDEIANLIITLAVHLPQEVPKTIELLTHLVSSQHDIPALLGDLIPHRTAQDVRNFCSDLAAGKAVHPDQGRILKLEQNTDDLARKESKRTSRVASLLLAREIEGNRGFGRMRQYANFQNEFRNAQEDGLTLIAEFTNCAGDIATTTWVPDDNIICGTTNHSDTHNQQYNKPGNLLLCSTSLGELRAFPDHRIPRPIVERGENSTEAMRHSQDPWLYSSVVSSDYDNHSGLAFTSSFDKTVKVWKVGMEGRSMTALATWHLKGNVNFVSVAKDKSGRVAVGADVPSHAVRIYTINKTDISNSPYISFSCSRTDADGSGKWAYFPATMQWGRSPGAQKILAVGYSPRSLAGFDHDIPEDKRNSGEVTLWDADRQCRLHVTTATTSNFFEIVWHPTLPRFIAATTPASVKVDRGVRTQIHLFQKDLDRRDGGYQEFQNLDCYASDINELTFMPNSLRHAYVTAGCTDGNVYVWDTAQGDKPIHILKHGHPIEEFHGDREKEDTGVKFTAWGITPDRFYTGSSDGVVKVWNVRKRCKPFIQNLLVAPGPISCGAFSPDSSRLVIGDATGRVFVLSVNKRNAAAANYITLPGTGQKVRRPVPFIRHPEPPPPEEASESMDVDGMDIDSNTLITTAADEARRTYLDTGKLILHPNPVIGAVQGPAYALTNLYCREDHFNEDPTGPLLPEIARKQCENTIFTSHSARSRSMRRFKDPALLSSSSSSQQQPPGVFELRHEENKKLDFDANRLDVVDLADLLSEKAVLWADEEEEWGFVYEEMPFEDLDLI